MEIAGEDHVIKTPYGTEALMLEYAVRFTLDRWPDCVVQDALTARFFGGVNDVPFKRMHELLVFRTIADMSSYNPGDKTLVHLLVRPGELTLHVDRGMPLTPELLVTLRNKVHA